MGDEIPEYIYVLPDTGQHFCSHSWATLALMKMGIGEPGPVHL